MADRTIWTEILSLREACDLFLDLPAPDADAENADAQDDERVIRQQVQGAIAMLQASVNVLAAHIFGLYGDPREITGGDQ